MGTYDNEFGYPRHNLSFDDDFPCDACNDYMDEMKVDPSVTEAKGFDCSVCPVEKTCPIMKAMNQKAKEEDEMWQQYAEDFERRR